FPCGGGGFFRAYPYVLSRSAIRRVHNRDRRPALFYFPPWEIDPAQPRVPRRHVETGVPHYPDLDRMAPRLRSLLSDFRPQRLDQGYPIAAAENNQTTREAATVVSEVMRKEFSTP